MWRAEIVLATADGHGTNEIMRRTGKSKPCVWRWQERYVEEGVDGLLRDKTRPLAQAAAAARRSSSRADQDGERDAAERDALEPGVDGEPRWASARRAWGASGPRPA